MAADARIRPPAFERARLRSERARIACMAGLFTAFLLLGVYRVLVPLPDSPALGWVVAALAASYLVGEAAMLLAVDRMLARGRALGPRLGSLHAGVECTFPVVGIFVLTALHPAGRFSLLVSPGYGFLLVLVGISVLRVDWRATVLTGAVATLGYGGLVAWALNMKAPGPENPHPPGMYVNLVLMLALATAASAFISVRVRGYVEAAVREAETRQQRDRLKENLEIAGIIQQGLLPSRMPDVPGYDFAAVSVPTDEASGDFYDWQTIGRDRLAIYLGDVMGHGIGPALITVVCRAYVRSALGDNPDPASVLCRVNTLLQADLPEGTFVTLALAELCPATHEVRLLSAGHGPTLHVRGADGEVRRIGSQLPPLGVVEGERCGEPVWLRLDPGDLLVLCSDGCFEPANAEGNAFGVQRLARVLRTHRHEPAARILAVIGETLGKFLGDNPRSDDITAFIIQRQSRMPLPQWRGPCVAWRRPRRGQLRQQCLGGKGTACSRAVRIHASPRVIPPRD